MCSGALSPVGAITAAVFHGLPFGIRIVVIERDAILEIHRRPQPIELRRGGGATGWLSGAPTGRTPHDRSRVPWTRSCDTAMRLPLTSIQPSYAAVLRQARIVHDRARPDAIGEARLLDRRRARAEREVGGDAVLVLVDANAQRASAARPRRHAAARRACPSAPCRARARRADCAARRRRRRKTRRPSRSAPDKRRAPPRRTPTHPACSR